MQPHLWRAVGVLRRQQDVKGKGAAGIGRLVGRKDDGLGSRIVAWQRCSNLVATGRFTRMQLGGPVCTEPFLGASDGPGGN